MVAKFKGRAKKKCQFRAYPKQIYVHVEGRGWARPRIMLQPLRRHVHLLTYIHAFWNPESMHLAVTSIAHKLSNKLLSHFITGLNMPNAFFLWPHIPEIHQPLGKVLRHGIITLTLKSSMSCPWSSHISRQQGSFPCGYFCPLILGFPSLTIYFFRANLNQLLKSSHRSAFVSCLT